MSFRSTDGAAALEDEVLARQASSEAAAFAELYERYVQPVHRYVRLRVPDETTAEDLTAQVFYKTLASASSFRGEGSYRAWIFQIARNTIATWRASKRRSEIPVEEVPDAAAATEAPVTPVLVEDDREVVLEIVEELPAAQREVVRLRYWKELTIDEIAHVTRRSTGAVRQLLHRARTGLRKRLSGKDLSALAGATGASALAIYSMARHRRNKS